MPSWENTPERTFICQGCGKEFQAKRGAKWCSSVCSNRARTRTYDPEARARQYRNRVSDPERKERYNAVSNERIRQVKQWIADYKVAQGCVDCGYNAHPAALDIDHMDGKTANVSSLKSIRAVEEEIERHKCVVRCANCHRIKSFLTQTWVRP
jgi:hypothetical protein